MKGYFFCVWLCSIVTLVASNPTAQKLPQQLRQFKNPAPFQKPACQSTPSNQNVKIQNQTPNLANFDGALLNDLLMSKILGNPSLQKILDPNTKLYKQNGQEIQRQPNPSVPPSIVNNYFIVPPEFFTIKENNTTLKSKSRSKTQTTSNKTRTSGRSPNSATLKIKPSTTSNGNKKSKIRNDVEMIDSNNNNHTKKGKNKQNRAKFAKLVEENVNKDTNNSDTKENKSKRKRKQNNTSKLTQTTTTDENTKVEIQKEEVMIAPEPEPTTNKRRKKLKKKSEVVSEPTVTDHATHQNNLPPKIEEVEISPAFELPEPKETDMKFAKLVEEPSHIFQLQPFNGSVKIEERKQTAPSTVPVQDDKYKNLKSLKNCNRSTSTKQVTRPNKELNQQKPIHSSVPDDIMKNYFPYMFMGNNNFYTNSNYPLNFEQLYQPYFATNNVKNNKPKTSRTRNTQTSQSKKKSPTNFVEVKLNSNKQNLTTTTDNPTSIESDEVIEESSINLNTSAESFEKLSEQRERELEKLEAHKFIQAKKDEAMIIDNDNHKVKPLDKDSTEMVLMSEFTLPKKETTVPKASLEMPPTVIEDLSTFVMPDLGKEDIMPTAHTNGIIADYYPIFHDDSYYANIGNFFLGDLEDERHFYTTDRGFDDNFNRERRKFEKNEDNLNSNIDFMDHVNFRKAFKYRERDKPKIDYETLIIKDINKDLNNNDDIFNIDIRNEELGKKEEIKHENMIENQFQTPPLLENPDFQTRKIERVSPVYDPNIHYSNEPIYTESIETVPEIQTFIDTNPRQYSRLVFDTGFEKQDHVSIDNHANKNKILSTTEKPVNDRIETVFAKTRVVQYGVTKDVTDEIPSLVPKVEKGEDKFFGDGHTTYVLAKSLGKPEDYFW